MYLLSEAKQIMSPKRPHTLATSDDEERHHRRRHDRVHRHRHEFHEHRHVGFGTMRKETSRAMEEVKKKTSFELDEEEANKSLYICFLEHSGDSVAYVIRAIKFSDLLSSGGPLRLQQVAFKAGDHLPGTVGSGVMGSQILIAGGLRPNIPYGFGAHRHHSAVWHRNVYAFDPNNNDNITIRKLDATLQGAKQSPMMVELGGKLYALSYRLVGDPPSFEVFDPKLGTWSALPQPPFFEYGSRYYENAPFSYAIAGTKMFVSHKECPVFCFDVAHPDREWRLVPTMCQGGPLPFAHKSLVLDLPEPHHEKKIMFGYSHERWYLGVYLMSLCENHETITRIGDLKLPQLPRALGEARGCDFVHIGGGKACIIVPELDLPYDEGPKEELGTHKTFGIAIPFQFEVDITKVDKGNKNCLTLQFMRIRIFRFHTTPDTLPFPETVGSYLL